MKKALIIVILSFVSIYFLIYSSNTQHHLFAYGCDAFGYARQAKLFRDGGLINGLDTKINKYELNLLIKKSKKLFNNTKSWSEMIAPHCHHYNKKSDKVIMQYPPGTGLVLSLFHEKFEQQALNILNAFIISAVLIILLLAYETTFKSSAIAIIYLIFMSWFLTHDNTYSSASIPATILLIPLILGIASIRYNNESYFIFKVVAFSILGCFCGLIVSIRIANILLIPGLIVFFFYNHKLYNIDKIKENSAWIALIIFGFILGILPLLISNKINAGGIFHTTYSSIDAHSLILSKNKIIQNLFFYFSNNYSWPPLVISIIVIFLSLFFHLFYSKNKKTFSYTIGALIVLMVSLIYFSIHSIIEPYYLIPASILSISMVAYEAIINCSEPKALSKMVASILIIPLALISFTKVIHLEPNQNNILIPEGLHKKNTIIWSDLSSGTLLYYNNLYSGKLAFGDQKTQYCLVHELFNDGIEQYFIIDSSKMNLTLNFLMKNFHFAQAGHYKSKYFNFIIWKLLTKSNKHA